ncbi:hypothetical protein L1049_012125 [Liquidambar formosana]|uniref:F-box domain-containing protein n=1 Tax=Liquidambar formosana TaxID=63359 RepID=A0AAP0X3S5_LIQFO
MEMLPKPEKAMPLSLGAKFFSLPLEIMFDILFRIPTKDLIRLKCVCKSFLDLVSHPSFVDDHLHRAKSQFGIIGNMSNFPPEAADNKFHYFSFNFDGQGVTADYLSMDPEPYLSEKLGYKITSILASCNGLLLLNWLFGDQPRLLVCNPTTRSSMVLPYPPSKGIDFFSWALVHDDSIKKYKVIGMTNYNIDEPHHEHARCFAFTLGCSRSWRAVATPHHLDEISKKSVAANGKLHWIASSEKYMEACRLCSIDIATEEFSEAPCPVHVDNALLHFLELNGSIYCTAGFSDKIEIWVLKDWDTKIWIKHHVLYRPETIDFCSWVDFQPIAIKESPHHQWDTTTTKLILRHHGRELLSYDLQSQEMSRIAVEIQGSIPNRFAVHVNSLVHWC